MLDYYCNSPYNIPAALTAETSKEAPAEKEQPDIVSTHPHIQTGKDETRRETN
jgi:hypothetical protein